MKTGLTLMELAAKIEGNKALKADYIAPTQKAQMNIHDDGTPVLQIPVPANPASTAGIAGEPEMREFPLLPIAHDQVAAHLDIPRKYYDRMRTEQPHLLANNVNTWFQKNPTRRMVRTLGGDVRAFLSDRYNRIENEEIAEVVLPILADIPDVRIVSAEITERRMYIQAVTPRIEGEVKKGDVVQAGVVISNSEVGMGAVSIAPMIFRLVCLNGMIAADGKLRANHVGGRISETEALYADDTRKADDRAVLLKVRDHVKNAVSEIAFAQRIEKMQSLTSVKVTGSPEAAVEVLARKVGLLESDRGGILRSLIEGGDLSAWGMLNAITAQAHNASTYDRSVEFEQMGGQLLDMPRAGWREVLEAA